MSSNKSIKSSANATPHNDDPVFIGPLEHAQAQNVAAVHESVTSQEAGATAGSERKLPELKDMGDGRYIQPIPFKFIQLGRGGGDYLTSEYGASTFDDENGKTFKITRVLQSSISLSDAS